MREIDIGNPKYTQNTLRLLSSGVKLFITFELKVIQHEERERDTQSFYADFSICPKLRADPPPPQTTGLASAGPESQPSRSEAGTQLTAFSQIPKIFSFSLPVHEVISYLEFYFDICEWRILPALA